jgi:hypothetical protein
VKMMKSKINNKCKCQYLIQDKSRLCSQWNQNSISTKMWAKKGTFSSITILRAIKCWGIEQDQFHSRDQTCQADRAINLWIKMVSIMDMTEIKWICKGRMKLITKTLVNMLTIILKMSIKIMFIHLLNKKILSTLSKKSVKSNNIFNNFRIHSSKNKFNWIKMKMKNKTIGCTKKTIEMIK